MPGGTRSEAIAPAAAPRKNGVNTDDAANATPKSRCRDNSRLALRNANAAPRPIMPNATRVSGMYNVDAIAANTGGKTVHKRTSTKINQTWLASQTGPMTCSMRARRGFPTAAEPASRSQMPAPKSAPASTTYRVSAPQISPNRSVTSHHRVGVGVALLRCQRYRRAAGELAQDHDQRDRQH